MTPLSLRLACFAILATGLLLGSCRKESPPGPPTTGFPESPEEVERKRIATKVEEWHRDLRAAKGDAKTFNRLANDLMNDTSIPPAEVFKIAKEEFEHEGHKAACYVKVMHRTMETSLREAIVAFEPLRRERQAAGSGHQLARKLGEKDPKAGIKWIQSFPEDGSDGRIGATRGGVERYFLISEFSQGVGEAAASLTPSEAEALLRELLASGQFDEKARKRLVYHVRAKLAERGLVDKETWDPTQEAK